MQIENGRTAHIHYTLTDNEGNVIDSSEGKSRWHTLLALETLFQDLIML